MWHGQIEEDFQGMFHRFMVHRYSLANQREQSCPPGAKKFPAGMTFFASYPGQGRPGMMPTSGNYEDSWWHTLGQPALKMRNFLMFLSAVGDDVKD